MGKGTRKRQNQKDEFKPVTEALDDAKRLDRYALLVFIATILILFVTTSMQIMSQVRMNWELEENSDGITHYSEKGNALDNIETLKDALPSGAISTALIAVGVCATGVFVMCRCPRLSFIGMAIAVIGAALFIPFVIKIGQLFPQHFREAGDNVIERGLTFKDLLIRHYSMLLPIFTIIPAIVLGFKAKKKREIAEVMRSAIANGSTLALEE